MFIKTKEGFLASNEDASEFIPKLDAGVYSLKIVESWNGDKSFLMPTSNYNVDYNVTCGVFGKAIDIVDKFLSPTMKTTRQILSMPDRIGLLFWGVPGTGKTFLAGQIGYTLSQSNNAICIMVKGIEGNISEIVDMIRKDDPNRMIVVVFDEFEKSRRQNHTDLLAFLDGADSKNNTIVIATLNDMDVLASTLVQRPGRFEHIIEFQIEDEDVLNSVINHLLPEEYHTKIDTKELATAIQMAYLNTLDDNSNAKLSIDFVRMAVKESLFQYLKTAVPVDFVVIE